MCMKRLAIYELKYCYNRQISMRKLVELTVDKIAVFPLSGGPTRMRAFPREVDLLRLRIQRTRNAH